METTEKIVESYCRYVKNWFTIPNIKCKGQFEIDLLAINNTNPLQIERFHIECSVSISSSFSKLTAKEFSSVRLKDKVQAPEQRRTIGFFENRKFNVPQVFEELEKYGFKDNYIRIIVTWDATEEAQRIAKEKNILIWFFPKILKEIANTHHKNSSYFTDDTARTIQLFALAHKTDNMTLTLT